jgi:DnaK suppressor protein
MDTPTLAKFKTVLLARRAGFFDQLAVLRGGAEGRAEASAEHFGQKQDSSAQEASAREIEFALDEHESAELALVDAALKRIEAGTYGRCVACGIDIPQARLSAAPEAARCLPCQQSLE